MKQKLPINNDEKVNQENLIPAKPKLWTKNFTIIILGSFVSMLGYSCTNFAFSLLSYNKTQSEFLYALMLVMGILPMLFVPIFAGAILDKKSRIKAIYILDFVCAGLYMIVAALQYFDFFNYVVYLFIIFVFGCINSFYGVAYESLYPNLISKGNYSKAYSISSLIYPIASTIMIPVAGIVFERIGLTPLFFFSSILFLITAAVETRIDAVEPHLVALKSIDLNQSSSVCAFDKSTISQELILDHTTTQKHEKKSVSKKSYLNVTENKAILTQKEDTQPNFYVDQSIDYPKNTHLLKVKQTLKSKPTFFRRFNADLKEGLNYIGHEKGLQRITAYFFCTMLAGATLSTLYLPYFETAYTNGIELFGGKFVLSSTIMYSVVMVSNTVGRLLGGILHYCAKLPANKKFSIAIFVYICLSLFEGSMLFVPFGLMIGFNLACGFLAVNSFNIRISGTQNYVPDRLRGRFNATFYLITNAGSIIGQLAGGALGEIVPQSYVVLGAYIFNLAAIILIMLTGHKHVKPIYNNDI